MNTGIRSKPYLKYLFVLLIVGYIFGPPVRGIPTYLNIGVISGIIFSLSATYVFLVKDIRMSDHFMLSYVGLVAIFLGMIGHNIIFSGNIEHYFNYLLIRLIIFTTLSGIFAICLGTIGFDLTDIVSAIMLFLIINSIIMIFSFINPDIQTAIDQFVNPVGLNIQDYEEKRRFRGLLNFEGAGLSVLYSLYFVFLLSLLDQYTEFRKRLFIISSPAIFAGIILSGRTGLLISVFIFIVSIFYFGKSAFLKVTIISMTPVVAFFSLYLILVPSVQAGIVGWILNIPRAFWVLVSEHLFLPSNAYTLFLGKGKYLISDSGFVRHIFVVGLIWTFLTWALMIYLTSYMPTKRKRLYLPLIAVLAVANIKEPFLLTQGFFKLVSVIAFLCVVDGFQQYSD